MTTLPPRSRRLLAHGTAILTLGLFAGLTIGAAARPETVLAAHLIGITAGLAAIATGLALPHVRLTRSLGLTLEVFLVPSLYLGFLTQWLAGLFGLSRMFVVTAAGLPEGAQWAERVVEVIVLGITPLTILPFLILGWALMRSPANAEIA